MSVSSVVGIIMIAIGIFLLGYMTGYTMRRDGF